MPKSRSPHAAACALLALALIPLSAPAQTVRSAEERAAQSGQEEADEGGALRLVRTAERYLEAKENERALGILQSVIERFPDSPVRFQAYLLLGKHYREQGKYPEAIETLRNIQMLDQPDAQLDAPTKELLQQALYLIGACHYESAQYASAFPVLRKLTRDHPNSPWASEAHYYIGMCHFVQRNWQKAIEALSLVGTFIDPDSPATQYIEAGRRLYVKLDDSDLPVQARLGRDVSVELTTASGDRETIPCVPLAAEGPLFLGSAPSQIGPATAGDGTLQIVGGDTVTVRYSDENTRDGTYGVPRESTVRVVSTAAAEFTLGTFEGRAAAAFVGQPVFVSLTDADLDTSPGAEEINVAIASKHKVRRSDEDPDAPIEPGEPEWVETTRDEVRLTLKEAASSQGGARSGRFVGSLALIPPDAPPGTPGLRALTGDEIVVAATDTLHLRGETPVEVTARIRVGGELENAPKATQYVVADPILRARKNLVETTAYLELGRIFRAMGLAEKAAEKCDQGLELAAAVLRDRSDVPPALAQDAFRLKWELEMVKDDFGAAIATCTLFSRLYPDSPLVDRALLGIGAIRLERKEFSEATAAFRKVLDLPLSQSKAEAQFRIAQTQEQMTPLNPKLSIPHYKLCAERYPDSEFAGESLAKLVDYYINTKDYRQADEQLSRIFEDHPDARFLDGMLLKWVIVSYRMGDTTKSKSKCEQLLFEFPESPYAERARALLEQIEARGSSATTEG